MPVWNSEFATSRESDRAKLEYADVIINIGEVFERREKFSNRYLFRYVSSIEYRLPGLFVKTSINRRKSRKRFMLLWNLRHSRGSIAKKTSLFTKNYRTMCRRVKFREREKANPIVSLLHCFFSNERNYTTIYIYICPDLGIRIFLIQSNLIQFSFFKESIFTPSFNSNVYPS